MTKRRSSRCSATHRVRSPSATTATPCTPRCSSRAIRPRRSTKGSFPTAVQALAVCRSQHQLRRRAGSGDRPHRASTTARSGKTTSVAIGRRRFGSIYPTKTSSRSMRPRIRRCSSSGPSDTYTGVGTILFNMAVNPVTGKVYVSNTEANNLTRFEGPGGFGGATTVRGKLHQARISVLDAGTTTPRHLNKHIDYNDCCDAVPNSVNDRSLSQPVDMVGFVGRQHALRRGIRFEQGRRLQHRRARERTPSFPSASDHIEVTGGGPAGLVLDEPRGRLYVLTRFDNSISVVLTGTGLEIVAPRAAQSGARQGRHGASLPLRRALRRRATARPPAAAVTSSATSTRSLGISETPTSAPSTTPAPSLSGPFIDPDFHPMKGPMTTQSLRGMDNHGPMHWRGDRTGGNDAVFSGQPDAGTFNEDAAFKKFNPAFEGLIGRSEQLDDDEMQAFTDFILQVIVSAEPDPPARQHAVAVGCRGQAQYSSSARSPTRSRTATVATCSTRTAIPATITRASSAATAATASRTSRRCSRSRTCETCTRRSACSAWRRCCSSTRATTATRAIRCEASASCTMARSTRCSASTARPCSTLSGINPTGIPVDPAGDLVRRDLESFMFEFDSNLKPMVGQQATLTSTSGVDVDARIDDMLDQADAGNCDVVVKGARRRRASRLRLRRAPATSRPTAPPTAPSPTPRCAAMRRSPGQEMTFTAVPPGDGNRIGVDRDEDGFRDARRDRRRQRPREPAQLPCGSSTRRSLSTPRSSRTPRASSRSRRKVAFGPYQNETVEVIASDNGGLILDGGALGDTSSRTTRRRRSSSRRPKAWSASRASP